MMVPSRRGFSLMEVLLATSILLASSIALIELATIGRKQANSAYDLNQAQLLCQAKLDEIVAGVVPLKGVESQELDDDPEWRYSVELRPLPMHELVAVVVTVFQAPETTRRPVQFSLVRWLMDTTLISSGNGTRSTASSSAQGGAAQGGAAQGASAVPRSRETNLNRSARNPGGVSIP
jgi:hypothetical protein